MIAALKALNGVPAEDIRFQWPSDLDTFSEPWKRSMQIGITSMTGFQTIVPDELIEPFSKELIASRYRQGDDAGVRRFQIPTQVNGEPDSNGAPDSES